MAVQAQLLTVRHDFTIAHNIFFVRRPSTGFPVQMAFSKIMQVRNGSNNTLVQYADEFEDMALHVQLLTMRHISHANLQDVHLHEFLHTSR